MSTSKYIMRLGDSRQFFTSWYAGAAFMVTAVIVGAAVAAEKWLYCIAAVVAAIIFLFPVQVGLGVFALLIPFDSIAAVGDTNRGRTLTWFAGAAAAVLLLGAGFLTRRLKFPPASSIWWILFVVWAGITSVWALSADVSLQRLPTAISLVALYLVTGCLRFTKRELHGIILLTILGGCIAAGWAALLVHRGQFFDPEARRASLMFGSRQANPNELGLSLLLPISLAFGYFSSAKNKIYKATMLLAVAAMSLGLLLTMSRSAFIALVVVFFVYLRRLRRASRAIVPALLLAILLWVIPSPFFTRFEQASQTGGSGRLDIWSAGLQAFTHYGLLGAGLDNFGFAYYQYAGTASHFRGLIRDSHNMYLAVAVETGLVGLFLFGAGIRSQIRSLADTARPGPYNVLVATEAVIWGALIFGMFGNVLWSKAFWIIWMLLAASTSISPEVQTRSAALDSLHQ